MAQKLKRRPTSERRNGGPHWTQPIANGVSAALDFAKYVFINCDLTLNLFRRPEGEWICLEARTLFGDNSCGMAESALYDELGMIGRATQTLAVRLR